MISKIQILQINNRLRIIGNVHHDCNFMTLDDDDQEPDDGPLVKIFHELLVPIRNDIPERFIIRNSLFKEIRR
mgnify:CR=1 FL=1